MSHNLDNDQEYNPGHMIEGLDRLSIIMANLDDFVLNHPAIKKSNANSHVVFAIEALGKAYQMVGQLED